MSEQMIYSTNSDLRRVKWGGGPGLQAGEANRKQSRTVPTETRELEYRQKHL